MLENWPTHMDYSGQKLAEKIFQVIIVCFAAIGFAVGYFSQQLSYAMYILGVGCFIACVTTLPPWSVYRKDPITWLPVKEVKEEALYSKAQPAKSSGKHSKKR